MPRVCRCASPVLIKKCKLCVWTQVVEVLHLQGHVCGIGPEGAAAGLRILILLLSVHRSAIAGPVVDDMARVAAVAAAAVCEVAPLCSAAGSAFVILQRSPHIKYQQ